MSNNNQPAPVSRSKKFRRKWYPFLWFVSAADESLLERCSTTEQDKQAGIGMAIVCTTVAAIISSWYAVQSLFDAWWIALPLALFWGLIIFNLDRFMVGSIRKDRERVFWKEFLVALPRIVLALFIAVLISKPLEVKIFQRQIEAHETIFNDSLVKRASQVRSADLAASQNYERTEEAKYEKQLQMSRDANNSPAYKQAALEYAACTTEYNNLQARLKSELSDRQLLYQKRAGLVADMNKLVAEGDADMASRIKRTIDATDQKILSASQQIKGFRSDINALNCDELGTAMNQKAQEYFSEQERQLKKSKDRMDSLEHKITDKAQVLEEETQSDSVKIQLAGTDILGRLRVLDNLKKEDSGMFWASWLITGLFFVLELAPLLVKMLSPRGEYDTLISISERQALNNEEACEEESRQETTARKKAAALNAIQVGTIDDKVKEQVQEKILAAQAQLAEKIVEAWKQQEEEDLDADTKSYLKNKIIHTTSLS
jgi:hypothetical protein